MKSLRFFFLFLTVTLLFSSCEKEDAAASAKNKALKEKVALEMKKAASDDAKKKPVKKTTAKKAVKKTTTLEKKVDPTLANRPNQKSAEDTDSKIDDEKKEVVEKKPVVEKKVLKTNARQKKQTTLRPAVIQIVTNFDNADATVNGLPYPEYVPQGEEAGMVLPAGGPYSVEVKIGDSVKYYELYLKPNETRVLFVSSTGGSTSPIRAKKAKKTEKKKETKKEEKKKDDKAPGKVTVYGKPAGTIMVDGVDKGEKTPGTIEMKNGRHEIQVKYNDSGEISEKKIVRVRSGSKIKLFFRERKK